MQQEGRFLILGWDAANVAKPMLFSGAALLPLGMMERGDCGTCLATGLFSPMRHHVAENIRSRLKED